MKLTPANTVKDGLETKVFDVQRNVFFDKDAVIDLEGLSLDLQMYYQRIAAEGDLVEFVEPAKPVKKEQLAKDGDN